MNQSPQYDYIIAGAGCAGLSLVMRLINQVLFQDKKILIIDKDEKIRNDRTWCFWEKAPGFFDPIVYKKWDQLFFYADNLSKPLLIAPYQYKLIRGIDFYQHCKENINTQPNITWLQAGIEQVFSNEKETGVWADGKKYTAYFVFNSLLPANPALKKKHHWLLQHFKGWVVETPLPAFDAARATLMDFRTEQSAGTSFFYLLPFTANRALVEYTIFSKEILADWQYEQALEGYIQNTLGLHKYTIKEKEFGVIPMTNFPFQKRKNNIINMGTAGGQTKGSSGYTFQAIQKHSAAIVNSLVKHNHPFAAREDSHRFHFYDSVLLHILANRTLEGSQIFTDLFKRNKANKVLKFLDNETTLPEELNIIRSLPTLPFSKAAMQQLRS